MAILLSRIKGSFDQIEHLNIKKGEHLMPPNGNDAKNTFWEKVDEITNEVFDMGKVAYERAVEAGKIGKMRIDRQVKISEIHNEFLKLGQLTYAKLAEEEMETISKNDEDVNELINNINSHHDEIEAIEEEIEKLKEARQNQENSDENSQ